MTLKSILAPMFVVSWFASSAFAAEPVPAGWDDLSDTWAATDGLGRSLPLNDVTGPVRPDRNVGIFFFLWNEGQNPVYDLTKIVAANPGHPAYGPNQSFHHWGEPLFGYYRQNDRYVLRKHVQMLGDAGVDVLLLDVTNALTYDAVRDSLLEVLDQFKASGQHAPQIAFLANSASAATVARSTGFGSCFSSTVRLRSRVTPISPVIVATTLAMGRVILAESALSFLGVGIQPQILLCRCDRPIPENERRKIIIAGLEAEAGKLRRTIDSGRELRPGRPQLAEHRPGRRRSSAALARGLRARLGRRDR